MGGLVVKSAIRSHIKGMRAGGDFMKALDAKVAEMVKMAMWRAKENGRKTCRAADL